jgi:hypothetical protein
MQKKRLRRTDKLVAALAADITNFKSVLTVNHPALQVPRPIDMHHEYFITR